MKNIWKWILATFMAAAACNALASSVESNIKISPNAPKTSSMTSPQAPMSQWRPVEDMLSSGYGYAYNKFELQLQHSNKCVRVLANNRLRMRPCNKGGKFDRAFWTARNDRSGTIGRSSWAKSCLWAPDVFAGHPIKNKAVFVATCTDGIKATLFGDTHTVMRETWLLLKDGRIALAAGGLETNGKDLKYAHFSHAPQCLEYSPRQDRVIVATCVYGKPTQQWKPDREHVK